MENVLERMLRIAKKDNMYDGKGKRQILGRFFKKLL